MNKHLENLKEYFENTPQEEIDKEWEEIESLNDLGPDVLEYADFVNKNESLDLTMNVWEKTLASQIIPIEDIPKSIEKILTNYCKRNIKVKGNGLTENMEVKII